jgi:hypothetical protein
MHDHVEIAAILNEEARCGRTTKSWTIFTEVPGMLPHDGQFRFASATTELGQARKALERALDRSTAFTFRGVVPEDLR